MFAGFGFLCMTLFVATLAHFETGRFRELHDFVLGGL